MIYFRTLLRLLGQDTFLAIVRISNVPLVPQHKTGLCWYASATMLVGWRVKMKGGLGPMTFPADHKEAKDMYANNRSLLGFGAAALKGWFGMKEVPVPTTQAEWAHTLSSNGPLWAAGKKHWNGEAYGHVVVVFGVADTGLLINDPEPIWKGREEWRTWASMNRYFSESESDVKLMACL